MVCGGHRDPQPRGRAGVLPGRDGLRRRLRRPLRGEGEPGRGRGRARDGAHRRRPRVPAPPRHEHGSVRVSFTSEARLHGDVAVWEVIVPTHGSWSIGIGVAVSIEDQEIEPRFVPGQPVSAPRRASDSRSACRGAVDRVRLPESRRDRRVGRGGPRRAAHVRPGVSRAHGRRRRGAVVHDAVRARLVDHVVDGVARRSGSRARVLQTLARFQGKEVDPRTEEEPGRTCTRCASARRRRCRSTAGASTTARPTRRRCSWCSSASCAGGGWRLRLSTPLAARRSGHGLDRALRGHRR